MHKHRNKQRPRPNGRQQAMDRQQEKELLAAKHGHIDETRAEIEQQIDEEANELPDDHTSSHEKKIKPWYVLDTNAIISCIDILYDKNDESWMKPVDFYPDLDDAFLIIPKAVRDELDHMKLEKSLRGLTAKIALRRIKKLCANSGRTVNDIGNLRNPIKTGIGTQTIACLPLFKEFKRCLPWAIPNEDYDSWIAATALAATLIRDNKKVDGSEKIDVKYLSNKNSNVILLTNDNEVHTKADELGVRTMNYSFTKRPEFTGIREITVPAEMFESFYHNEQIHIDDFEHYMPDEAPLAANEYLVMTPEDDRYPRGYFVDKEANKFANIGRYHVENGLITPLRFMKYEGVTPKNSGIAAYYDALNDDSIKVINVTGPAGTGKTYQAITHAIKAVRAGRFVKIILVPSRPAKNPLGALPGGMKEKMEPLIGAAKDAISSYLANTPEFTKMRENLKKFGDDIHETSSEVENNENDKKKKDKGANKRNSSRDSRYSNYDFTRSAGGEEDFDDYSGGNNNKSNKKKNKDKTFYPGKADKKDAGDGKIRYFEKLKLETDYLYERFFLSVPYEQVEGRSFDDCIIILDEFQRVQVDDSDTIITRPGNRSKLVICGDIAQIHDSSPEKAFNNGLNYARMLYFDEQIAANINLTENMRGDISRIATKNRYGVRRAMGLI